MNCKDEIDYFDLNDDMVYYEVEIWRDGDCDSRYFKSLKSAKAFFKSHVNDEADCVKKHCRGDCCFVVLDNQ